MYEIDAWIGIETCKDRRIPIGTAGRNTEFAPSDMRQFERLARRVGIRNLQNAAGDKTQPFVAAKLFAILHEQLHADANAEQRALTTGKLLDRACQPANFQLFHAIAESSDAGQYHTIRIGDASRIAGDLDLGTT